MRGILNRYSDGRDAAGVAVVQRPGEQPQSIWLPSSLPDEPMFLAYSVTKTVIAVLILLLQDERQLDIDENPTRWFSQLAGSEQMSLRQLLNHTAGVPDYGSLPQYHEAVRVSPSTPWSTEQFAAETFGKGLSFPPGTDWAYSNPGYMLLKQIAEQVAEATFADLVAQRIAEPLKLRRLFVPQSVADLSSLAPAPSRLLSVDRAFCDIRDYYHPGWVSHGVVASPPSELAAFLDALFHGRLISSKSLNEMTRLVPVPVTPSATDRLRKPSQGLGLMADPESPWGSVWGHNGGGPGYTTSAFHAPGLGGVSVCAMGAIEEGFDAEEVVFNVLDSFLPNI
jgi:D-alanyl-D-alanine carboxypeptidase